MGRNAVIWPRVVEILADDLGDVRGCAIDGGVQIGTAVLDHDDRRVVQANLDATVLLNATTRPVFVTDANCDPLDAVSVSRQHKAQLAPYVLGQRHRQRESLSVEVDNHLAPFASPSVATLRI